MDNSFDVEDQSARLSLSLVSYGSDVENDNSINDESNTLRDTLVAQPYADFSKENDTEPPSFSSEENDLIKSVQSHLGLSGVSSAKLDQLSSALERMKVSQTKFLQAKLKLDAVVHIAQTPSKLNPASAKKVNQVLEHIGLLNYTAPLDIQSTDGLFGITPEHIAEHLPNELSPLDSKYLREAVEEEIALKHQSLIQMSERSYEVLSDVIGPVNSNSISCAEDNSTHELLSLCKDLHLKRSMNYALLDNLDDVSQELTKLNFETFKNINTKRVELYGRRCQVLKNQIRSINEQITNGIYLEDKHLSNAYTTLKKKLDLVIMDDKTKLLQLKEKEVEFEKLRGTHFDQMVREYLDLTNQIKSKQYALDNLSS